MMRKQVIYVSLLSEACVAVQDIQAHPQGLLHGGKPFHV